MIIPLLAYVEKSKKIKILISQVLIPYLISLIEPKLFWTYKIDVNMIIYIFAGYIIQNYKFSNFMKIIIYILGMFGLIYSYLWNTNINYKIQKNFLFTFRLFKLSMCYLFLFFIFIY